MNKTIKFSVNNKDKGQRLDVFLTNQIENFTRSFLKKLIKNKKVKLNGFIVSSPSSKLKYNDNISVNVIENANQKLIPKKTQLDIIYEDNDILIVNKPKGLVVHPGAGNYENTLVNYLIYSYKKNLSDINGILRPGIVHRIDKETSGLLVIAKNNLAHSNLGKQ